MEGDSTSPISYLLYIYGRYENYGRDIDLVSLFLAMGYRVPTDDASFQWVKEQRRKGKEAFISAWHPIDKCVTLMPVAALSLCIEKYKLVKQFGEEERKTYKEWMEEWEKQLKS